MIYVDSSVFISYLFAVDDNHARAQELLGNIPVDEMLASYSVVGEVLTVGSQRYDRAVTLSFIQYMFKEQWRCVREDADTLDRTFQIFQTITQKNISWVDCYSVAVMQSMGVRQIATFDKDFKKLKTVLYDF